MGNDIFRRWEIKYLLTSEQKSALMPLFSRYMVPDAYGESTICNIYYDTPDFRLIRRSLEKPVYKEKLRIRSYGPAAAQENIFLELKKKYDGVVYKRRITVPQDTAVSFLNFESELPIQSQIGHEITWFRDFYQALQPAVYLSYDRSAWFSESDGNFRITFDSNICWRRDRMSLTSDPGGRPILHPDQYLMEIKTSGSIPLWLVAFLNEGRIRQTSFSKYGQAYTTLLNEHRRTANGGIIYA